MKTSTNCCPLQAAKGGGPVPEEAVLLRVTRDFQNAAVERSAWQAVVFSHDTEHVAACSDEHRLYMWSLVGGTLEGILEFEGELSCISPYHCCFSFNTLISVPEQHAYHSWRYKPLALARYAPLYKR